MSLDPKRLPLSAINRFYRRYEKWLSVLFFILGFVMDLFGSGRLDSPWQIFQKSAYLVIAALIVFFEIHFEQTASRTHLVRTGSEITFRKYYRPLIHFILGSLLSAYTVFYFKSASPFTSIGFVILLSLMLVANNFPVFRGQGSTLRLVLFGLCMTSFLIYLVPILIGSIGPTSFLLAIAGSLAIFGVLAAGWKFLSGTPNSWLMRRILLPLVSLELLLGIFYFTHAIPPVPLSIRAIGIYHELHKENGKYRLLTSQPEWRYWVRGDQSFNARKGDRAWFFVRIFTPTRLSDRLQLRWMYKTDNGAWRQSDGIPITVTGGREEGYRGVSYKDHYWPGSWRVQVETSDGRELGRLYFKITADETTGARVFRTEIH